MFLWIVLGRRPLIATVRRTHKWIVYVRNAEHPITDRKTPFSLRRLLVAVAVLAIAIAMFQRASASIVHALATMRGPVIISIPALLYQWLALSLTIGGIAVLPYGRKGLVLGLVVAGICIPLLVLAFHYVRAGGNL